MEKGLIYFLVSLILIHSPVFAQDHYKVFEISLPEEKVFYSSYKTISLVDAREDTSQFGRVLTGAFDRKAKVVTKIPLTEQLVQVMNAMTDATAGQGELLLELRQFRFAELTGFSNNRGFFNLRANLYTKESDSFHLLKSIDTLVIFKAIDVTNGLLRRGGKVLTDFVGNNLLNRNYSEKHYSLDEITNLKIIEKLNIPLYQVTQFADGYYNSYNSFKLQIPDRQIKVKKDNFHNIKTVKIKSESGAFIKVKSKDVYAVVYNGEAFVATKFGYYPLIKKDYEFYFQGKSDLPGPGNVALATALFGIAGAVIAASSHPHAILEMRIDHLTGEFIPVRPIKK